MEYYNTVQSFLEVKPSIEPTTSSFAKNKNISTRLADISYYSQRILVRVDSSVSSVSPYSSDDKVEVWKSLFPDKPIPMIKRGAAKSNFGILNREIKEEVDEEEFEDLLRQSRST